MVGLFRDKIAKTKRQYIKFFTILILVFLNFVALNDITTGNEPNYYVEWTIILLSIIFVFVYIAMKQKRGGRK